MDWGVGGTAWHSYAVGVGIIEFLGSFVASYVVHAYLLPPTHSDICSLTKLWTIG